MCFLRRGAALGAIAVAVTGTGRADLLLNEILYDPAGADSGREFVEILNAGSEAVSLSGVRLEAGDGARPDSWRVAWSAAPGTLAPGAWLVVGGDSLPGPHRLVVDLQNGPDAVRLVRGSTRLDVVGYGALEFPEYYAGRPAPDISGASLARWPDGHDTGDNAADFAARPPSPGRPNWPARALALRFDPIDAASTWPGRRIATRLTLVNAGRETLRAPDFRLETTLEQLEDMEPERVVAALPLEVDPPCGPIAPDDSCGSVIAWLGDRGLHRLRVRAVVAGGEPESVRVFVRIGAGPVIVNEIHYAPDVGMVEWVELWNRDANEWSLAGWTLEDASGRAGRLLASRQLAAGAYAVAASDTQASLPPLPSGAVRVLVSPWPALNNTDGEDGFADAVVLRDAAGRVVDAVRYKGAWGVPGRSLERLVTDPDLRGLLWAACKDPARATPGRANSAVGPPLVRAIIDIQPNPFSPDGDGHEDSLGIGLEVPEGHVGFRAALFDLDGRRRRTLAADRLGPGPRRLLWDGRDSAGVDLPTGVYIVHFEFQSKSGTGLEARRVVGLVRP